MEAYVDILRKLGDQRVVELRRVADESRLTRSPKLPRQLSFAALRLRLRRRPATRPAVLG